MKIVVSGGGTGGHVYPAIAVALAARERDHQVKYYGSLRGQERRACKKMGIEFTGYRSRPLPSLRTVRGLLMATRMLGLTAKAFRDLSREKPDLIFSTGGYSAAPVTQAAKRLRIPIVVHEQNSVPGRTNRLLGNYASAVCTMFERTARYFPADKVQRTGLPIRPEMRKGLQGVFNERFNLDPERPVVLVMGGSQGSAMLNDAALATAVRMSGRQVQWLHLAGIRFFESTMNSLRKMGNVDNYVLKAFLEGEDIASAFFLSDLAICRSGAGTVAELAAFRKPSVLVPFKLAFEDHQLHNAREIEALGAADIVQEDELQPSRLEKMLQRWLEDAQRQATARQKLAEWDVEDSTDRILDIMADCRRKAVKKT